MGKKEMILNEIMLMAENEMSVETSLDKLSERCGLTISETRRLLFVLESKAKVRIQKGRNVGGYEKLAIEIKV